MQKHQALLRTIESRSAETIELARELVAVPSENPPGDEREMAHCVAERLEAAGLADVEVLAKEPNRANVLASLPGSRRRPRLIYNAHLDTKPIGDVQRWSIDPRNPRIVDGQLYGRGAVDMKSQIAAFIAAGQALVEADVKLDGELIFAMTADEEAGGRMGLKYLAEEGLLRGDAALIAEPSGMERSFDSLCVACRGSVCFKVKSYGTQMHSSMSDVKHGVNASVKLAETLARMAGEFRLQSEPHPLYPQGPTVNLGVTLAGGVSFGVLPGYAEFGTDIRLPPGLEADDVVRQVTRFLDALQAEDPDLELELEVYRSMGPAEIAPEHPLVSATRAAAGEVLGDEPRVTGFPGGTDAPHLIEGAGVPTLPAFGPGLLSLAHGPDERVDTSDIIKAAKIYALAAINYFATENTHGRE